MPPLLSIAAMRDVYDQQLAEERIAIELERARTLEMHKREALALAQTQEAEQGERGRLGERAWKRLQQKKAAQERMKRISSSNSAYVFAIFLAIIKDILDPLSDLALGGFTTLLGAAETLVGTLTALLNAIPIIGTVIFTAINAMVAAVFASIGFSAELVSFIVRMSIAFGIFLLIGRRVSITARLFLIGITVVDLIPIIRNIPAETASVIATYVFSTVEKYTEPVRKAAGKAKKLGRTARAAGRAGRAAGRAVAGGAKKLAGAVAG